MERLKNIIKRLLHPNIFVRIILEILSAVFLIYIFIYGEENSPEAYIAYILSAYAVTVLTLSAVNIIKKVKLRIIENPYASRYASDRELRAIISLSASTLMNVLYVLFRIASGLLYRSVWSGAVGGYYVVLSLIRIVLMKDVKDIYINKQSAKQLNECWRSYRLCGILMFLLNCVMVGMAVQMIWQNKSYNYPGTMIYVSAMYTFYSFTMTIVNIIKFRRLNNPVLSAAKMINFAGALMSLFALQTAMFTQFGGTDEYRRLMNIITGAGVCCIVIIEAIYMIWHANREIKNLTEAD